MKYSFITFSVVVSLLIACDSKPKKNQFMLELEADLSEVTITRIQTADRLFEEYVRNHSAGDSNGISMEARLHRLCKKFYASADSITNSMNEASEREGLGLRLAILDSIYHATTDSIETWFPKVFNENGLHRSDFKESSLPQSALLTSTLMQYDVAMNEIVVLQAGTKKRSEHGDYVDDDAGVTTNRFPAPGHQYSFAIKNKFIQQFAAREVLIDSITMDGQPLALSPVIDNRDIFRVVELHDLRKGKYTVRIGIGSSYFFSHRFQIK